MSSSPSLLTCTSGSRPGPLCARVLMHVAGQRAAGAIVLVLRTAQACGLEAQLGRKMHAAAHRRKACAHSLCIGPPSPASRGTLLGKEQGLRDKPLRLCITSRCLTHLSAQQHTGQPLHARLAPGRLRAVCSVMQGKAGKQQHQESGQAEARRARQALSPCASPQVRRGKLGLPIWRHQRRRRATGGEDAER